MGKKTEGHLFLYGQLLFIVLFPTSSTDWTCRHADTLLLRQREKVNNAYTDPLPYNLTSLHSRAPLAHGQQQMALSVSNPEVACINLL